MIYMAVFYGICLTMLLKTFVLLGVRGLGAVWSYLSALIHV